ncbi:MAG: PAS domain-containing sensor histidine kinase [bacterium]
MKKKSVFTANIAQKILKTLPVGIVVANYHLINNELKLREILHVSQQFKQKLNLSTRHKIISFMQMCLNRIISPGELKTAIENNVALEPVPVHDAVLVFSFHGDNILSCSILEEDQTKPEALQINDDDLQFRSIFNSLQDAIFILDFNGNMLEVNNYACNILGYSKDELLQLTPADVSVKREMLSTGEAESFEMQYEQLRQSEQLFFSSALRSRTGKTIPVESKTKIIKYHNKDAILVVVRDVTERTYFERRIFATILETEQKERKRFSEDLHDGLGPLLSSIKMYVSMLLSSNFSEKDKEKLGSEALDLIRQAINATSEISKNLMPYILRDYGLASAVRALIEKISFMQTIKVEFDENIGKQRYSKEIELMLYRIISELLNNTLKYASASFIKLKIIKNIDFIDISYKDNGIGFDHDLVMKSKPGSGLQNIITRVKSVGGNIIINSAPGRGMDVKIKISS